MRISEAALFLSDIAEEYFSSYRRSWNWLKRLNSEIYGNERTDYLKEKMVAGGMIKESKEGLELLEVGQMELFKQFPLLQWRTAKWDGKWRIVIYDIPENQRVKRDLLRVWLKRLGFGQWQQSVWVSPHPLVAKMTEVLKKVGLEEVCNVYESEKMVGVSDEQFAEKIWELQKINSMYLKMLETFNKNSRSRYLKILMKDPMLPSELLPKDWTWNRLMLRIMQIKPNGR